MSWSFRIGRIRGIDIFLHWTFVILLGFVFVAHLLKGQGVGLAVRGAGLMLALFACVLLHELGHAIAAQRFGIRTKDITLLPIGGIARLMRMPDKPWQEFIVAVAGPAVNVVIAVALAVFLALENGFAEVGGIDVVGGPFIQTLMSANVFLVLFNMLPAFPMDGGRVLRALLASFMDYGAATRIAASVGKGMAVLFGFAGLIFYPMLLFIAMFVFLGAHAEAETVQTTRMLRGLRVADAMLTRFQTLTETDSLESAARELLAGSQHDFPVVRGGRVAGILTRAQLVRGLAERGCDATVGEFMRSDCPTLSERDPLDAALGLIRETGASNIPVLRSGELVGLLTAENLQELVMLRGALAGETA